MKNRNNIAVAAAILMGSAVLTACTGGAVSTPGGVVQVQNVENQVISVSSSEEVKITPDMAEIVYGVYTQAEDAKACQENNGKQLDRVIEMLKNMGFEEKSIQTSNYDLNPIYDWNSGQTITGYEMETRVTVSDIAIEKVGEIISGSVDAGVNNIRSVTYLSSKYDEAYQEALKKAVAAATTKAQAMAEAGDCKIGAIVNITEYDGGQEARYTGYMSAGAGAKAEAAMDTAAINVMPGEVSVQARITVEFAVNR
ncbi:SIMPL domain-containing protein [Clostridium sp. AM58-1XD]|uniref:SIMPL domain-containing protein n=1 Tax=Clostridium sp. AM58-1XD TaxID=2292307 RepID=UPI000E4A947E|nr:SIMPL domain-containing protein [Clostridium sp. AM58-1XD]RGZ00153.1 DUF541 domain-containing protein [Clostridium sp. AM58-1XD]